jgi:hypothetical protein
MCWLTRVCGALHGGKPCSPCSVAPDLGEGRVSHERLGVALDHWHGPFGMFGCRVSTKFLNCNVRVHACRFLTTLEGTLQGVEIVTAGLPESRNWLSAQQGKVTAAIVECEVWAKTHKFYNAIQDKV